MKYTLENFYQSKEWVTLRATLMNERTNEDGVIICEDCGKPILRAYDCIGHHKIELTEDNVNDATISLNPDNVKLVHFKCHNKAHDRWQGWKPDQGYKFEKQHVYIVYGSPCSGKNSFVRENANEDDLVVDLDALYKAITLADGEHSQPWRVKNNVFRLRDSLYDQIRTRTGQWRNAWIIGTYPLRTDRDRLCNLLGAEPVYIEATIEECLARAEKERPEAWKDYIRDWFESHTE